jgi:hypothetical protein
MKCIYKLEDNLNLTLIRRVDDNDLTDPVQAVAKYLRTCRLDYEDIKVMSGGRTLKAAGMKFYVISLR